MVQIPRVHCLHLRLSRFGYRFHSRAEGECRAEAGIQVPLAEDKMNCLVVDGLGQSTMDTECRIVIEFRSIPARRNKNL